MSTEQPTRLRGPVPDGLMHITLDVPNVVFEELRETCRRRGISLDRLILAALRTAATTP